jgi:C4-dicarboxylate transporter DctM subunit
LDILTLVGISIIILLFLSGAPLAIAFGVGSGIVLLIVMGIPLGTIAQMAFGAIHSYPLLACPFFILAGYLILHSGGMIPLRDFMQAMVGHWPGGLPVAAIVFAAFLGSISGSATACLAILGTVILPILVQAGYSRPFVSGISTVASELGLLIPPSMFFIIFGAMNQISIADLFIAGIGPGILSTIFMGLFAVLISKRRRYPTVPSSSWGVRSKAFFRAFPVLFMPVIVLGGIYGGVFSPTQAAAVSVLYAILMGKFVYHDLNWGKIKESLVNTAKLSSMIYLLIIGADLLSKMLTFIELPQRITDFVISMELGPTGFLLTVNGMLLLMGFVFGSLPMIIIVLPLFLPSVYALGIDPVFYGALTILNSLISEVTPPFGPELWFAAPICNEKMGSIAREAIPFLGALTLTLLLMIIFPDIAMFLVNLTR